jgi:hypothetical protein
MMAATPRRPSSISRCFLESLKAEAEVDVIPEKELESNRGQVYEIQE